MVSCGEPAKGPALCCRLWVLVTSVTPLKVYLFDGGVVIFGSVNKKRKEFDLPADDEVRSHQTCLCYTSLQCKCLHVYVCDTSRGPHHNLTTKEYPFIGGS